MSQIFIHHTPSWSRIVFGVTRNLRSFEAFLDQILISETGAPEFSAPQSGSASIEGPHFRLTETDGRLEVVSSGFSAEQIIDRLMVEGYELTAECEGALASSLSPVEPPVPISRTESIHMHRSDLEWLERRGLLVQGVVVTVEVVGEESYNGFRTVRFFVGRDAVEVYLDVRNERGGPYQFTHQSKQILKAGG